MWSPQNHLLSWHTALSRRSRPNHLANIMQAILTVALCWMLVTALPGCNSRTSSVSSGQSHVDTPERPTALHVAEFTHNFPNAGNAGLRPERVEGKPFYGFDEQNFSSLTRLDGAETEAKFQFRLLDSRDGKDIYEITRTITNRRKLGGSVNSESTGKPETVTVEYGGQELVVFDDEFGIAKFTPVSEANSHQDAEVQFDLPEVEVDGDPGEVEPELRPMLPNRKAND